MSYNIISFVESNKEVASQEKRLSICLTSNGFSFSLTDRNDNLLTFCEVACDTNASMSQLLNDIKGVFSETHTHPVGLRETELVVFSRQFVWVPEGLYDETRQREYLEALCKIGNGYGVFSCKNETVKAYAVFSACNNTVSAFKIAIPGLKIRCQHDKMANATVTEASDLKSLLLVNVGEGWSDYAVFCNKKLQLSNSFECSNFEETVYYAINLTKQFHLEDAGMVTAVCGDVDRDRFALLSGYLPNVALYSGRQLTLQESRMQHIPLYRHAILLS